MLTFVSFSCKYFNSFTARASYAAWKNELVSNHCNDGPRISLLINNPVNNRLGKPTES